MNRTLGWLALVSLLLSLPAAAQQVTVVTGTVSDASGAVLPGTTVEARGGGVTIVTMTAADGRYELELPDAGTYRLRAQLEGTQQGLERAEKRLAAEREG